MHRWLAVSFLLLSHGLAAEEDPCLVAIPEKVAKVVTARFPEYRLPLTSDSDPDAVALNRKNRGTGCNAGASADFNGDGTPDYAIILTSKSDQVPLLVAAMSSRSGYSVSSLRSFDVQARKRLYADPLAPGRFTRTAAADSDSLGKGEVRQLQSPHPGIAVGKVESWELGYFFTSHGWRWVWLAN